MKFLFKGLQECYFRPFLTLDFWNLRNPPKPIRAVLLDVGGIGLFKDFVMNFRLSLFLPWFSPWDQVSQILTVSYVPKIWCYGTETGLLPNR